MDMDLDRNSQCIFLEMWLFLLEKTIDLDGFFQRKGLKKVYNMSCLSKCSHSCLDNVQLSVLDLTDPMWDTELWEIPAAFLPPARNRFILPLMLPPSNSVSLP